jgi:hypothetical protein
MLVSSPSERGWRGASKTPLYFKYGAPKAPRAALDSLRLVLLFLCTVIPFGERPRYSRATSGTGIAPEGDPSEGRRRRVSPENPMAAPPAAPEQFRLAIRSLIEQRYGKNTAGLEAGITFCGFSANSNT